MGLKGKQNIFKLTTYIFVLIQVFIYYLEGLTAAELKRK